VVNGMNSEKVPGPDSFIMAFFQVCWDMIKADVMGVFHDFHARSKVWKVLMLLSLLLFQKNPELLILRTFNKWSYQSGILIVFVEVQFWEEIAFLDSTLYLFGALFYFGESESFRILQ
jgi:hypothetical protein